MDKLALGETFKDFFHISVPQDMYSMVSNKRAARFILHSKFLRDQKFSQAYIFGFCGLFHCHLIEM